MSVDNLEKEVITLRVQNRYAALQLQNIQDEIDNFTSQYYSAVEDLCIQLAEIENKLKNYDDKISGAEAAGLPGGTDDFTNIKLRENDSTQERIDLESEVKKLYRNLIKLVHPDVSEEKLKAAEYAMMVNKAYNERNLHQLVELDQLIRSGNATEREFLQQRNKLIDSTFELKMQKEDLLENPMYLLSVKFAEQEDGGIAMVRDVRKRLESKIAERKRDLMEKKIEYLALVGDRISAG